MATTEIIKAHHTTRTRYLTATALAGTLCGVAALTLGAGTAVADAQLKDLGGGDRVVDTTGNVNSDVTAGSSKDGAVDVRSYPQIGIWVPPVTLPPICIPVIGCTSGGTEPGYWLGGDPDPGTAKVSVGNVDALYDGQFGVRAYSNNVFDISTGQGVSITAQSVDADGAGIDAAVYSIYFNGVPERVTGVGNISITVAPNLDEDTWSVRSQNSTAISARTGVGVITISTGDVYGGTNGIEAIVKVDGLDGINDFLDNPIVSGLLGFIPHFPSKALISLS